MEISFCSWQKVWGMLDPEWTHSYKMWDYVKSCQSTPWRLAGPTEKLTLNVFQIIPGIFRGLLLLFIHWSKKFKSSLTIPMKRNASTHFASMWTDEPSFSPEDVPSDPKIPVIDCFRIIVSSTEKKKSYPSILSKGLGLTASTYWDPAQTLPFLSPPFSISL